MTLNLASSDDDYFDVDSVLASDDRVKVELRYGATAMGFLSGTGVNLHAGDVVELPLWAAARLHLDRDLVRMRAPPYFRRREVINDAALLDLRSATPHYYQIGATVSTMIGSSMKTEIVPKVRGVFRERFLRVVDLAQNPHDQDETEFTDRLTNLERKYYAAGLERTHEIQRWKRRELVRIESERPPEGKRAKRF